MVVKLPLLRKEAVEVSHSVAVGSNDLAQVVHALQDRGGSAGNVKGRETPRFRR